MSKYKIRVSIDEENFFWIIARDGNIIKDPTNEELGETVVKSYNKTNICPICRKENNITDKSILYPKNAYVEKDKNWDETGEWTCYKHWKRNYNKNPDSTNNIMKLLRNSRIGSLDPNSSKGKGDKGQKLLCIWKGFKDLNKENDNYTFPIDCIDESTGLYYQVKTAYYNSTYKRWNQGFKNECNTIRSGLRFKSLFLLCISKDGKKVDRIYEIPEEYVVCRIGINIYDNPMNSRHTSPVIPWYDKYRIKDEEELKKVNKIWQEMPDEKIRQ